MRLPHAQIEVKLPTAAACTQHRCCVAAVARCRSRFKTCATALSHKPKSGWVWSWSVVLGIAHVCVFQAACAGNGTRGARVQRVGHSKQAARQRLHKTRDRASAGAWERGCCACDGLVRMLARACACLAEAFPFCPVSRADDWIRCSCGNHDTRQRQRQKHARCHELILIAFITGNSSLEPLIEGLCAQIHVNLR